MSGDGEKYVGADGRFDIDAVRADHKPDEHEEFCRRCHEEWPCSLAHAAHRIAIHRSAAR